MNYLEFKHKVQNLPIIVGKDLAAREKNRQILRNQLNRWQQKKLVVKLKRGMYMLNENDRKINPSRHFIANQLYGPSYISLESALNFYGMIPERVADMTSITTRKTMLLKNGLGNFVYQHIKPQAFRGFKEVKDSSGLTFFIAEPEKAVLDLFYLNLGKIPEDEDFFEQHFRFQNTEGLKTRKVLELGSLFNNSKLTRIAKYFCGFIKNTL